MTDGVGLFISEDGVGQFIGLRQIRITQFGRSKDWDDLVKLLFRISTKPGIERWEDDWDADMKLCKGQLEVKNYLYEKMENGTVPLEFVWETDVEYLRVAEKVEELSEKWSLAVDFISSELSNQVREELLDTFDFKWTAERKRYWESLSPNRLNYEVIRNTCIHLPRSPRLADWANAQSHP